MRNMANRLWAENDQKVIYHWVGDNQLEWDRLMRNNAHRLTGKLARAGPESQPIEPERCAGDGTELLLNYCQSVHGAVCLLNSSLTHSVALESDSDPKSETLSVCINESSPMSEPSGTLDCDNGQDNVKR